MREKKDVLKDLPDKIRSAVKCEITTRKEYKVALDDLETYLREYKNADEEQIKRSLKGEVMVRIGALKNISSRGKMGAVVDYISDIIEANEKVVVFVHLKEIAETILTFFPNAVTVLGRDSMLVRQKNIDSFQNDLNTQIIICSIKAAGVGLTLTASSRVAFVDLPWHDADATQCEDRCHRIGTKSSVHSTFFLGQNTIDEWIYDVINDKKNLAKTITGAKQDIEENVFSRVLGRLYEKLKI